MSKRRENFLKCLKDAKADALQRKDQGMATIIMEINNFVKGCTYTTCKIGKSVLESCSHGYSDKDTALALGVTEERVRGVRKQLSDELYDVYGTDIFELLMDYRQNYDIIRGRLDYASHLSDGLHNLVCSEVLRGMHSYGKKSRRSYDLRDCEEEIDFLIKYSVQNIENNLEILDKDKIAYLLEVINGTKGDRDSRMKLIKNLN